MDFPTEVTCEGCGATVPVAQAKHTDHVGKRLSWAKVRTQADGLYVLFDCPTCGERPQKIVDRNL